MNSGSKTPRINSTNEQYDVPKAERHSSFMFSSRENANKPDDDNGWDHELKRRAQTEEDTGESEADFVMNTEGDEY